MATNHPVTVSTLTFRRPAELDRLLPRLVQQAATILPTADVLVIDNDPAGGAAENVASYRAAGVRYIHEPTPGIAAARNRAIREAEAIGSAAIVFIDDDEIPTDGWLASLVELWRKESPAAVAGAVIRIADGDIDPWVRECGVFDRWKFPTGTRVPGGATNNLLLDLAQLRDLELGFDDRFGLSGGSDTMLLKSLVDRGGEIVWCDEAQVRDPLPAKRLTRSWMRRRYFRTGNTWVRVHLELAAQRNGRNRARVRLASGACGNLARGFGRIALGTILGRRALRAQGTCQVASALGALFACAGYVYVEYARKPAQQ